MVYTVAEVVSQVYTRKEALTAGPVRVGQNVDYRVTVNVDATLTSTYSFTDQPGTGLSFAGVVTRGNFTCTGATCSLPAGTAPGAYEITYRNTVTADARNTVTNTVVPNADYPCPVAAYCTVTLPVVAPTVTTRKIPITAEPVRIGQDVAYLIRTTVEGSALTSDYSFSDQPGTGLQWGAVMARGNFTCNGATCSLAAGTAAGTYEMIYRNTVTDAAAGRATVSNTVVPNAAYPCPVPANCTVTRTVATTDIAVTKAVNPTGTVPTGSVVTYTVTARNNGATAATNVRLTDTPGTGLDCTTPSTTATCTASGGASCPSATVRVSDLTSTTGITIASMPSGGQAVLTMQCTVTATGR